MKSMRLILLLTAAIVPFLVIPHLVAAAEPSGHLVGNRCGPSLFSDYEGIGDFDLSYCQMQCRIRFGLEPLGSGAGGQSQTDDSDAEYSTMAAYDLYTACIEGCHRRFWHEFDQKTGGDKKP
jgi:hypothetical protein